MAFRYPRFAAPFCVALAAMAGVPAGPAMAKTEQCRARIAGETVDMQYDTKAGVYSSMRERFLTKASTCPGRVVLNYLTPNLTADQREGFCVIWDDAKNSYSGFLLGKPDAYGRCRQGGMICRFVNATHEDVTSLAANARRAGASVSSAMPDGTGAMIVTGNAAAISGSVTTAVGSTLAAAIAAPAAAVGAAVGVVAMGGAVWVCSGQDQMGSPQPATQPASQPAAAPQEAAPSAPATTTEDAAPAISVPAPSEAAPDSNAAAGTPADTAPDTPAESTPEAAKP